MTPSELKTLRETVLETDARGKQLSNDVHDLMDWQMEAANSFTDAVSVIREQHRMLEVAKEALDNLLGGIGALTTTRGEQVTQCPVGIKARKALRELDGAV